MLLSENVSNLIFSRPKKRREYEIVCSDKSKDEAIEFLNPDYYQQLFKVEKFVRRDALNQPI